MRLLCGVDSCVMCGVDSCVLCETLVRCRLLCDEHSRIIKTFEWTRLLRDTYIVREPPPLQVANVCVLCVCMLWGGYDE